MSGYKIRTQVRLASVSWMVPPELLYWGDIDTAGFAIVNGLHSHWPHTRSLLMDEATLLAFRSLWSTDEVPIARQLPTLSPEECEVYEGLLQARWRTGVRLEQERIPWSVAWRALQQATGSS